MTQVYVVCWKYSDNSGFGILRAYVNRDKAEDLRDILAEHGEPGKIYLVWPTKIGRDDG